MTGDQRVGGERAALIGAQHLALPLQRFAIVAVEPRPRHRNLNAAEGSRQRPRPVAMAVTGKTDRTIGILVRQLWSSTVARAQKSQIKLAVDHGLDKAAHPIPHAGFDRIEPIVKKVDRRVTCML